ncbi:hypothetical protein [Permianibacter aggregans]|uniref:PsiF repeat-containing protein n=1 Tax=Permianibacter aggregans TaxID=1510150 RepID=A0A4R6UTC4_9GAMM|nr:hypothetical protein [Permianibacter aggregans]QGX38625.1 hypothetical protein E2H98_02700 [Permianibacter aggregans]TDQ50411.1 hypothetical protein EV696_10292 [Permianibacter aggregans]
MKQLLTIVLLTAVTMGCASTVSESAKVGTNKANTEATTPGKSVAELDKVKCTNEQKTGTRLKSKICMTDRERQAAREQAQQAVSDHMRKSSLEGAQQ